MSKAARKPNGGRARLPTISGVKVTFWSMPGDDAESEDLRHRDPRVANDAGFPLARSVSDQRCFHHSHVTVPEFGAGLLQITSPRPFRLSVDSVPLFDEILSWRSFQREIRAALILPGRRKQWTLRWEFGPRPSVPGFVTDDCPSRNRKRILEDIAATFPDRLGISCSRIDKTNAQLVAMRFSPVQFRFQGMVWQELFVKLPTDYLNAPSTDETPPKDTYCRVSSSASPCAVREATSTQDRLSRQRRLYVPIAELDSLGRSVRRANVRERRIEPRLAITGKVDLTLTGLEGAVSIGMPVYETVGRLSSTYAFADTGGFPTFDRLITQVPEPLLPSEWAPMGCLYREAWRMLLGLVRSPRRESGLPCDYISTGSAFENHQFLWDTCFTTMATAYGWKAMPATNGLDLLYSRQQDGGYIHREIDTRDGLPALFEQDFSPNPPLLALAEWRLFKFSGNITRLKNVWPALVAYHQWIQANRSLPNGTFWTTGLANGLDNSPSLGEGYPDLTAQMAHDAETLSQIARVIGHAEESTRWKKRYNEIGTALNKHLWSESMQFYSSSVRSGGHNPNKVVTGFWPLWAGIVPPDRAAALAVHLESPATFLRHHPVPSLAADAPNFEPGGCYWLGSTWAPTNYALIKGFQRARYNDLARRTAFRHLTCMSEVFQTTGRLWENYSSEKSAPGNWSNPDYSWTALSPIALLFEVVLGLEPDAQNRRLHWRPEPGQPIGVRRFPLADATITLVQKNLRSGDIVEVETDAPFTLVVHRGGQKRNFSCPPDRTAFSFRDDW